MWMKMFIVCVHIWYLFKQMVHNDSDIVNNLIQLEYLCVLATESQ